jgi:hypothetical protein
MTNFKGTMVIGDLQENTVTIEMEESIILKAGEYMVIPVEKYTEPELLLALNKIAQFSDIGNDFTAVVKMKSIAVDAIKKVTEI